MIASRSMLYPNGDNSSSSAGTFAVVCASVGRSLWKTGAPVLFASSRVGMVFVGGGFPVMTELPIRPYDVWSNLKVCFLKGVQLDEVKSRMISGALLADGVANIAISKCWRRRKSREQRCIYLLAYRR